MKIEECKIGMKVKCTTGVYGDVDKDKVYKIKSIKNEAIKSLGFEGINCGYPAYLPKFFESVNKFEVGDEVIWCNYKAKIWGVRYDDEVNMYEYAIEDNKDNCGRTIVFEGGLSPLKKKDELEVGDKFIFNDSKVKIEGVGFDEFEEIKVYLGKRLSDGMVFKFREHEIDEIIYD